jgi:hypothetical protein
MKYIINGKKYRIPQVSDLKCSKFISVFGSGEDIDLKAYLSLFIDMPIDDLMNASIKSSSIPAIQASLFDIDINTVIKNPQNTLHYNNKYYLISDMSLDTFGKAYVFDLYFEKHKSNQINNFELCMYATSCFLSESPDTDEIQKVYDKLLEYNWTDIIPISFFLAKKLLRKKKGFLIWWLKSTLALRRMRLVSLCRMTR